MFHTQQARRIHGATGEYASQVNDIYEFTEEMSSGMPVYRKMDDPDMWLMFIATEKAWFLLPTSDKGTNSGDAFLPCNPPCLPERGAKGTWQVRYDARYFEDQRGMDIFIIWDEEDLR